MARLRLRKRSDAPFAIQGPAHADRRTKDMIPRLQAGDPLVERGFVVVVAQGARDHDWRVAAQSQAEGQER